MYLKIIHLNYCIYQILMIMKETFDYIFQLLFIIIISNQNISQTENIILKQGWILTYYSCEITHLSVYHRQVTIPITTSVIHPYQIVPTLACFLSLKSNPIIPPRTHASRTMLITIMSIGSVYTTIIPDHMTRITSRSRPCKCKTNRHPIADSVSKYLEIG